MKRKAIVANSGRLSLRTQARSIFVLILLSTMMHLSIPSVSYAGEPLQASDFVLAAPQGFDDRNNSWAWSMLWWNGHLYVGTNRAWHCAENAGLSRILPQEFPYPPEDPDVLCTRNIADLPLQAEIWRWSPVTGDWERVYQSPRDVPIPGTFGKLTARNIGFRGLSVFVEPSGKEAIYAAGVGPGFVWPDMPPPEILRSLDGVHFQAIPQDPGTELGNFPFSSFRNQISFKNRFYIIGGTVQGSGLLLESSLPSFGNNSFRVVSTPDQVVSAVASFNGFLYLGLQHSVQGFSVVKTDAEGPIPYEYTPVVERGGYAVNNPNQEVLFMTEFQDSLYVGGNGVNSGRFGPEGTADLIRINADDTWDLIVGDPRIFTPDGPKMPLSGYGPGFDSPFNGHMWRMEVFNDNLYVGTFDSSTILKNDPINEPTLRGQMGFDLYVTSDGENYSPVTTTGFGDKFSFGVRSLEATPYGLFLGSTNYYHGLQIWRAVDESMLNAQAPYRYFLPWVSTVESP